jgi:hypothetical protein
MEETGKYKKDKRLNSFAISNAWFAKGSTTIATNGVVEVKQSELNESRKDGMDLVTASSICKGTSCGRSCLLIGGRKVQFVVEGRDSSNFRVAGIGASIVGKMQVTWKWLLT